MIVRYAPRTVIELDGGDRAEWNPDLLALFIDYQIEPHIYLKIAVITP